MIASIHLHAQYHDTDQMGLIHHSTNIVWFETARMKLLKELGIDYNHVERVGYLLVVTRCDVKYLQPAYFDDDITVQAAFVKMTPIRLQVHYKILRDERQLLSVGYTEHAFIRSDNKRLTAIPEFISGKIILSDDAVNWFKLIK